MLDFQEKVMSAEEAVKRYISPGSHIAFGGFTILRRPMAIGREVLPYVRWQENMGYPLCLV